MFLDFLGLEGTINEQAKQFLENTKRNPQWTLFNEQIVTTGIFKDFL